MKKIITLILLFISIISFGQNKEYRKAVNLFNDKKYTEANTIIEKLLNKEYGELEVSQQFYCLQMNLNSYSILNDFKTAHDKAIVYFEYIKNSKTLFVDDNAKNKTIAETEKFLSDLKTKISKESDSPSEKNIATASRNGTKTDDSESKVGESTKSISDDKTVTLTVSGTGKTLEEAKLNALRSAIEQAFGAFISSKTEILNDNLIKDEIVSVASGNVEKYDIVSQVEVPNVGYATTLSATVSISKLTTFAESKGVVVEFKGGMFGANIKLQKLNENSEIIAISNLTSTSFDILSNAIEFELSVSEPKLKKYSEDDYNIDFTVSTKTNSNYITFVEYFKSTISKLALSNQEVEDYKKLNKNLYNLTVDGTSYWFRTNKTAKMLYCFFAGSPILATSFKIHSNIGITKFSFGSIFSGFRSLSDNGAQYIFDASYRQGYNYIKSYKGPPIAHNFVYFTTLDKLNKSILLYTDLFSMSLYNITYTEIREDYPIFFNSNFQFPIFKFTKIFKLSEIEKINEFKLEKIDINDFLKNRNLYMLPEPVYDYSCFLSGTKISTPQGNKSIENIKVGDEVICFDDKGDLHTSIVESVNIHKNQDVYKYSVWNGKSLYATPNHWVLTSENSFSEIGKVNEMLTLVDTNGGLKPITKVENYGKETVYNFIVKDYHTYIANDIRVHNGGKGKSHLNISKN